VSEKASSSIDFGGLLRLKPVSREFGFDRGQPIDRHYVETFLAQHAEDVKGRVLEIGDNSYTRYYGGERVTRSDVLHVAPDNPAATIVGDLAHADHIEADSFDCFILTQTLHLIYDVPQAIRTIYRILKPGGVLLATFPGISQISDDQWASEWLWSFSSLSAQRLFAELFPVANLQVSTYGNVLTATAFLQGLSAQEITEEELSYHDSRYELLISVRAVKPE
jgi:SAM-dependent methyltransferase